MSLPNPDAVLAAMEATWPPVETARQGPFLVRRGAGGGKRVSAARATGPADAGDIESAEAAMRAMGQTPLFMLRPGDEALDRVLAERGCDLVDPVALYARAPLPGPVPDSGADPTDAAARLWDRGGIDANRLAVMARVATPKAVLALPDAALPKAVGFVAVGAGGAMFHALHVDPAARRRGLGRALTRGALAWAAARGAPWLGLAVTEANGPAGALYASLGFQPVGRYWYRSSRG